MLKPQTPIVPNIDLPIAKFAENQTEYNTLPAYRYNDSQGSVLTRWKVPLWDRIKLLFSGDIYLLLLTFNHPLQPIKIMVNELDTDELEYLKGKI